ncbi:MULTISPECIES: ATP-binding response regulator [Bacteroidales]|uniref:histidine kinase n=1 Tax=Bacteroides eggerthii TaxID=28111 RepID=A0A975KDY5_9BACE|nr:MULTISPECIES: ATP-binding protein [Bacteroides]QUT18453.1 Histidine kinase-, DNA gyrase B-, and HSP90-like ATPase [Parabacteroides distasonis]QUT37621.1 Histidine kinase-, DNA gyrase B-, and HSP90-like ATPase [Bacteroides uniformis]QUT44252.1 Histidine kinase-, DNA gyrase B-, and HSP90-like ATPase [Bacteroides eggerthii]
MWLKLKILLGYVILLLLLVLTIHIFRKEQTRRNSLRQDEQELACIRHLARETYAGLLGLATYGETASVWDESDFGLYHTKKDSVCNMLQTLKRYVKSPEQQSRIDSLCLLLERKELLLDTVMDTFERLRKTGKIVNRRIPAIVSRIRQADVLPAEKKKEEETPKKGFWSFIRPERKKSAYLQQKEQLERRRQSGGKHQGTASVMSMLYSLDREVTDVQEIERERLLEQMDLLYGNNTDLNHRLRRIVRDFEADAGVRLDKRYRQFISIRDRSFHTVSLLALLVSSLTVLLYLIIHRDLNRISRYQRLLEVSNRENTELLQSRKNMMLTIAHDLRAPLATIKGCAELLHGEEKKSHKDEYAENILHSSDYMIGLVNTLIEFYLLDTGRNKPSLSIFRLETLFCETARNYGSLAKKKKLRLTTAFSGLDVVVSGDRSRIQQILNNLLSNAIKFTQQGEINLQAEYRNKELHFSVQDTGTGMTEEEKGRIFAAFERLDNARDIPGFGLGLAIASRLASGMQGTLSVRSKPSEGSTFIVFLPLLEADGSAQIEETPAVVDCHLDDIHVLVIDDDRIQLNIIREMFHRNGIRCDCCQTSRELIARLRSHRYDLLLTDMQMPETDGYGILELLRSSNIENAKTVPVMAVTARADDEGGYLSGGFSSCIRKPFSMDELISAVTEVVGEKSLREHEPDFSLILAGEDNKKEMLGLFIEESRKDLAALTSALDRKDKTAAVSVLHKKLPLWETIRLDFPLSRLRELVTDPATEWTGGQLMEIREIIRAVEKLTAYVEKMRKESL